MPSNVLELCLNERQRTGGPIHVLQFYDKSRSWYLDDPFDILLAQYLSLLARQVLTLDKLRLLGEDKG